MDSKNNNSDFEGYRRKMHGERQTESRPVVPAPKRAVSIAFGIFMIIVYVGVGVLLLVNFFRWDGSFTWVRIVLGILLIIYGVFRAYRQFVGSDYYNK
ncbi:MAG: DUF308 domain-containing protein [Bacteroidales bacterium]|nr:DUF308 domain-containing protein [Bacteroidales bacterium]